MSNVPPSPAIAMTSTLSYNSLLVFFIALIAASIPLATAAAFSNAIWIHGIAQLVYGNIVVATSKHPVALTIIVGPLSANPSNLTIIGTEQPAHILCPGNSMGRLVSASFLRFNSKGDSCFSPCLNVTSPYLISDIGNTSFMFIL